MTELLNEFHAAKCSDGRDRVYSLNSLSNRPWPVDYHPYVEQVHFELATHQIRRCPTPFLACAGTFRSKDDTLPTWTPDWRVVPAFKPFSVNDEWAFKTVDHNVKIYTDGLRIRIKVMEIGTVRDCHETLKGPDALTSRGRKLHQCPLWRVSLDFTKYAQVSYLGDSVQNSWTLIPLARIVSCQPTSRMAGIYQTKLLLAYKVSARHLSSWVHVLHLSCHTSSLLTHLGCVYNRPM
jgi:hypothetical protein